VNYAETEMQTGGNMGKSNVLWTAIPDMIMASAAVVAVAFSVKAWLLSKAYV
jgi:hypothetical protein